MIPVKIAREARVYNRGYYCQGLQSKLSDISGTFITLAKQKCEYIFSILHQYPLYIGYINIGDDLTKPNMVQVWISFKIFMRKSENG